MFQLDISLNTFTRLPNIGKTLVTPRVLLHEGFSLSISALHTNQGLAGKVQCFKHNLLSSYVQFCHWLQGLSEVHTPKVFHFTAWTNYVRIDDLRTRHVSTLKVTTWEKTGSVRFHGGKCWSLPLTHKLTLWSWFPNAFSCDKVHATVLRGAATSHPQTKSRCLSGGKMSSKGQGHRPS